MDYEMIKIILIVLGVICFFTVCPMVAVSCYLFSRKNYHNFVAHPERLDHPAYAQWKKPILENMEWMLKQPAEEVRILSEEGFPLAAEWYHNNSKKTVILVHGYKTTPFNNFSSIARIFLEHGWNVLMVWQRAHGKSGGHATTFGLKERRDPQKWAEWVDQNVGGSIAIYGVSMGAASLAYASDRVFPESVRSFVIDCPYCRPYDQMLDMCRDSFPPLKYLLFLICGFAKILLGVNMKDDIRDALKNTSVPSVFISGEQDQTVPLKTVRAAYEACAAEKELIIVPEATHTLSFLAGGESAQNKVFAFLDSKA